MYALKTCVLDPIALIMACHITHPVHRKIWGKAKNSGQD